MGGGSGFAFYLEKVRSDGQIYSDQGTRRERSALKWPKWWGIPSSKLPVF